MDGQVSPTYIWSPPRGKSSNTKACHSTRARSPTGAVCVYPNTGPNTRRSTRGKKKQEAERKATAKPQTNSTNKPRMHALSAWPRRNSPVAPSLNPSRHVPHRKPGWFPRRSCPPREHCPLCLAALLFCRPRPPVVARACHTAAVEASRKTSLIHDDDRATQACLKRNSGRRLWHHPTDPVDIFCLDGKCRNSPLRQPRVVAPACCPLSCTTNVVMFSARLSCETLHLGRHSKVELHTPEDRNSEAC